MTRRALSVVRAFHAFRAFSAPWRRLRVALASTLAVAAAGPALAAPSPLDGAGLALAVARPPPAAARVDPLDALRPLPALGPLLPIGARVPLAAARPASAALSGRLALAWPPEVAPMTGAIGATASVPSTARPGAEDPLSDGFPPAPPVPVASGAASGERIAPHGVEGDAGPSGEDGAGPSRRGGADVPRRAAPGASDAAAGASDVPAVSAVPRRPAPHAPPTPPAATAGGGAGGTAGSPTAPASHATPSASRTASGPVAAAAARESAREARDTAREARDTAREARDTGREARDTGRDTARDAREHAREQSREARETSRDARESAREARDVRESREPREGRTYTPGPFRSIEIAGSASVTFVQSAVDEVLVEGDAAVQRSISLVVRDGKLTIDQDSAWKFWRGTRTRIEVRARELTGLSISGAADFTVATPLRARQLAVRISGSGTARFAQLDAGELDFIVDGAGDGKVAGAVRDLKVRISGHSGFQGEDLRVERGSIAISGVGTVRVWARQDLDIAVAGVGRVDYWGTAVVRRNVAGMAQIIDRGAKISPP